MIGKKLFFITILVLPFMAQAQSLTDITVKRERTFTGAGLYGFMNGGADLYLEYGVYKLVTRDVTYKGEDYTLDIYDLPSAADAFGIYSLHTFKCQRTDTLGCFDCLSAYQLQLAVGNQYISVVFQSGSKAAKQAVDELVHLYVNPNCDSSLLIPAQLNLTPPYSGTVKYLRGALSVSNAQSSLLKTVEGISFLGIWLVTDKLTKESRALINLSNTEDLIKLKEQVDEADVMESGDTYLLIKIKKKAVERNDYGSSFGF